MVHKCHTISSSKRFFDIAKLESFDVSLNIEQTMFNV